MTSPFTIYNFTIYRTMLGSLQFLRDHSNCPFFPGTPECSLHSILLHFTFEQYSGCTNIFHQMSTLSYLQPINVICMVQYEVCWPMGSALTGRAPQQLTKPPFKYLNWLWTAMITDDKSVLHILNCTHTT